MRVPDSPAHRKTTGAFIKINVDPSFLCRSDGILRASMYTFLTVQAVVKTVHDLYSGKLGFRIGTPLAAKRASLQEDGGSHTGSVVNGKLLYIKYDTFDFHEKLPLIPHKLTKDSRKGRHDSQSDPDDIVRSLHALS